MSKVTRGCPADPNAGRAATTFGREPLDREFFSDVLPIWLWGQGPWVTISACVAILEWSEPQARRRRGRGWVRPAATGDRSLKFANG